MLLGALLAASCDHNIFSPPSIFTDSAAPSPPSKLILVTNGPINKPYIKLGLVEYTLKRYTSVLVSQNDLRNQAIEALKQEALDKFGDRVDVIMNIKIEESTEGGYDAPLSVTYVRGTAVAFDPGAKKVTKHRTKHKGKSAKNTSRKTKPSKNAVRKAEPAEREITQSEILK
jgi:hypothetical protein